MNPEPEAKCGRGRCARMILGVPPQAHACVLGALLLLVLLLVGANRAFSGRDFWSGWVEASELRKPAYAERVRADELFRTRVNTWSNLAYVLIGFYAIAFGWGDRTNRRPKDSNYLIQTPGMSFLFGAACCYLGFGSGLFHASLTRRGQQLDVAAMYAPLLVLIAMGVGRWVPRVRWGGKAEGLPTWPIMSGLVVGASFLLYWYKWSMRSGVVLPSLILGSRPWRCSTDSKRAGASAWAGWS